MIYFYFLVLFFYYTHCAPALVSLTDAYTRIHTRMQGVHARMQRKHTRMQRGIAHRCIHTHKHTYTYNTDINHLDIYGLIRVCNVYIRACNIRVCNVYMRACNAFIHTHTHTHNTDINHLDIYGRAAIDVAKYWNMTRQVSGLGQSLG